MKLEWLEDLLAVIETDSLNEAASRRYLTQPAFTRRMQSIERYVGADLFNRSRKPLQLKPAVKNNEFRIRELISSLHALTRDLKHADNTEAMLVLGCQHSISTAVAPTVVKNLSANTESRIRIRSANRDECYALLLTGAVDIALIYQSENEAPEPRSDYLDSQILGKDEFIPVTGDIQKVRKDLSRPGSDLDIVAYPENVFLGQLFSQSVMPQISGHYSLRWIAETALTPAALQFALSGVGISWVPRSLAQGHLDNNSLVDLSDKLPSLSMEICALKVKKNVDSDSVAHSAWKWLLSYRLS